MSTDSTPICTEPAAAQRFAPEPTQSRLAAHEEVKKLREGSDGEAGKDATLVNAGDRETIAGAAAGFHAETERPTTMLEASDACSDSARLAKTKQLADDYLAGQCRATLLAALLHAVGELGLFRVLNYKDVASYAYEHLGLGKTTVSKMRKTGAFLASKDYPPNNCSLQDVYALAVAEPRIPRDVFAKIMAEAFAGTLKRDALAQRLARGCVHSNASDEGGNERGRSDFRITVDFRNARRLSAWRTHTAFLVKIGFAKDEHDACYRTCEKLFDSYDRPEPTDGAPTRPASVAQLKPTAPASLDPRIYIPTRGRAEQQVTYEQLPALLWGRVTFVVNHDEQSLYEQYPNVLVAPGSVDTAAKKRQFIVDQHDVVKHGRKILLLDDDLRFYERRIDEPEKFKNASAESVCECIAALGEALDDFAHAGLCSREGGNRITEDQEGARVVRVHAYDVNILREHNVRFDRLSVMEDFDVTLQLLRLGIANKLLAAWSQGHGSSNAPGGCSIYRTPKVQAEASEKLAELHAPFVKVVVKETSSSWGGGRRTDVRVQWKAALADGLAARALEADTTGSVHQ